jgi:glycosyltransferase involved in cell wall biosynthesis
MATGRPVVAARVGGIPEFVIADTTGILIPPGDPGALAKAVLDLAGDQDRRAAMAAAGRRHVREAFDRMNTNRAFEAVFRAALGPVAE